MNAARPEHSRHAPRCRGAAATLLWGVATALAACRGPEPPEPSAPEPSAPAPVTYALEPVVPAGSAFHGVHGLRFGPDGRLYAGSVIGQSIFRVDVDTGTVERVIGPPEGMADDIAFGADGTMVWTAIEDGIVYARSPDGAVRRLVEDRKGVNAVAFSADGSRLFVTLVFYGDALYELDFSGAEPPRPIAENLGGLNAFDVSDEGVIYGPLVFGGRVVRVDPDTGEVTTVSEQFTSPGALKLDGSGGAYVLDEHELKHVELATGATRVVAELPSGGDNLALGADGRLFVSMAAPNAIVEVDRDSGALRYVVGPAPLNSPTGLAVRSDGGRDILYVGDLFGGVRTLDPATGAIDDAPVELFQPAHVSLRDESLLIVSEVFGVVQRLHRESFEVLAAWEGFARPGDALWTPAGELIVAETGAGRVLRVTGAGEADRQAIATGLAEPVGLAWAGGDAVYVTERAGGRLLRVSVRDGSTVVEADGLDRPEGVAVARDGAVLVMEVGARRLRRLEPREGADGVLADDLPVGLSDGPSLFRSVAVGRESIYFNSDVRNTIYRLTPR